MGIRMETEKGEEKKKEDWLNGIENRSNTCNCALMMELLKKEDCKERLITQQRETITMLRGLIINLKQNL